MVSNKKKSVPKKHNKNSKKKASKKKASKQAYLNSYLPRRGTLPGRVFQWLNSRPMLFAELSGNVQREMGLEGDNLASQLSATLHDLRERGVLERMDPVTRKILPGKGSRGALYALEARARAIYRVSLSDASASAHRVGLEASQNEPRQRDLSGFATGMAVGVDAAHASAVSSRRTMAAKPAHMPDAMYDTLMAQRRAAEKQVDAIDTLLAAWV